VDLLSGIDPLVIIHSLDKMFDLFLGNCKIVISRSINLLFFDHAYKVFFETFFFCLPDGSHADLHAMRL
jgi:hypothetical protein